MALTTYIELQAAVADWMHRSNLTGNIADFIALAEARAKAILRDRFQQSVITITATPGQEYVVMPDTVLHVHAVSIDTVAPSVAYMPPDQFNATYTATYSGAPANYTIVGLQLFLGPTPDSAYVLNITQDAEFEPLSALSPVNALLGRWPNVYLWGALMNAADFCEDEPKRAKNEAKFLSAINDINILDWNTPGPMCVRPDVRSI